MTGSGVLPQVFLNLRRVFTPNEFTPHCYKAITNLTTDFMDIEFVKKVATLSHQTIIPDLSKEEKHSLRKEGWVVISQYVSSFSYYRQYNYYTILLHHILQFYERFFFLIYFQSKKKTMCVCVLCL